MKEAVIIAVCMHVHGLNVVCNKNEPGTTSAFLAYPSINVSLNTYVFGLRVTISTQ